MADQNPANTSFGGHSIFSRVSAFRASHRIILSISLLGDNKQISVQFKGSALGQEILDAVCEQIDVVERDYFGLRYQDDGKFRYWLDLTKPLNKQFKSDFVNLSLRIRFYPKDFYLLREKVTRYQLFVQLRRDLLHGRLYVPQAIAVQLAALVLQSVLGDYDPTQNLHGYVSEYQLLLKQTERHEEQIHIAHKELVGMTPADAESRFLAIATKQTTYGFDPYVVKDVKQSQDLVIGATCNGLLIFSKKNVVSHIPWEQVSKIDYSKKELYVYPTQSFVESSKTNGNEILDMTVSTIGFESVSENVMNDTLTSTCFLKSSKSSKKQQFKLTCPNNAYAKHLWRHLLSQQAFFTEDSARLVKPKFSKPKIPFFTRGSTFRCPTKRVLHEIQNEQLPPREQEPHNFQRYGLPKQAPRINLSTCSRSATLRSTKLSTSPAVSTSQINVDEAAIETSTLCDVPFKASIETLTKTTPAGPLSSTPVHSEYSLPQFAFTPTDGASTSRKHAEILNTTLDTTSSTISVESIKDEDVKSTTIEEIPMVQKIVQTKETTLEASNANGNGNLPYNYVSGNTKPNDENQEVISSSDSAIKKAFRGILSIILFLITLSTFAIIMFENNDGRGSKFTRDVPMIANFRQVVYEPSKDVFQQFLHHFQ